MEHLTCNFIRTRGTCTSVRISLLEKTDHEGVILPAGVRLKPLRFSCTMHDYREHRKIMFHRKPLEQDWNHVNDNFDLDTAVNSLHSTLEKLMNECFPRKSIRMSSRDPPWMSPLVKSLLKKKKTRSRNGGGRDLTELTEKIGRLIAENRRALASGKLGSRAWWRKVDRLSMRKDKCSSDPDNDFIFGLNDYFGDICFDREYSKPVPAEIDVNTPAPQLSTFQVFLALSRIKRTATGPDGIPFWT